MILADLDGALSGAGSVVLAAFVLGASAALWRIYMAVTVHTPRRLDEQDDTIVGFGARLDTVCTAVTTHVQAEDVARAADLLDRNARQADQDARHAQVSAEMHETAGLIRADLVKHRETMDARLGKGDTRMGKIEADVKLIKSMLGTTLAKFARAEAEADPDADSEPD